MAAKPMYALYAWLAALWRRALARALSYNAESALAAVSAAARVADLAAQRHGCRRAARGASCCLGGRCGGR